MAAPERMFGYDDQGNVTSDSLTQESATHDAQDRLIEQGPWSYPHNAEGQRLHRYGEFPLDYGYDARGLLASAQTPSIDTIGYGYDPLGRRVQRAVKVMDNETASARWLYRDALRPAAEFSPNGALRSRFLQVGERNVPEALILNGQAHWLVTDPRGSVRRVVWVSDGAVVEERSYDAWGAGSIVKGPVQPFGFAGGLADEGMG